MTDDLWTWGGAYFGYREGDDLWTHTGQHVGHFHGDEVYGLDGRYLGEIMSDNRLITNDAKSSQRESSFTPYANRAARVPYVNYVGRDIETFPPRKVWHEPAEAICERHATARSS